MLPEEQAAKRAARKAERLALLGGPPKKIVARLNHKQWERASRIRDKFGFKSIYEMNQYLWGCFLRVPIRNTKKIRIPYRMKSK
ncbi:hypothetical protein ACIXFU_08510 [Bacteroides fragilis]